MPPPLPPTCPFHPILYQLPQLCPCNTPNLAPLTALNYLTSAPYTLSDWKMTRLRIRISLSFCLRLSLPCLWHKSRSRSKSRPTSPSSPSPSPLDPIPSPPPKPKMPPNRQSLTPPPSYRKKGTPLMTGTYQFYPLDGMMTVTRSIRTPGRHHHRPP